MGIIITCRSCDFKREIDELEDEKVILKICAEVSAHCRICHDIYLEEGH